MSILSKEVRLTQNAALGAALEWRFCCGYNEAHPTRGFAPLPLLFIVLAAVLHEQTAEFIASTQRASGLRAFTAKFSESSVSKQDVLFGLHSRAERWRQLSWDSFRLALATRLLLLNMDGTVTPLSNTPARGSVADSVRPLLAQSEKLGFWCGQQSMHEIANLLRVRF
jgi:Family of unknown function (DUF6521)